MFERIRSKRAPGPAPAQAAACPEVAAATHGGRTGRANEDSFLLIRLPAADDVLLAVADGVGGEDAGEIASCFALRKLLQCRLGVNGNQQLQGLDHARQVLVGGLKQANFYLAAINARFGSHGFCMGTTVTSVLFFRGQAIIGHAGDSRCYLWRHGSLQQITRDETWAEELRGGKHRAEAGDSRVTYANVLSNCLGLSADARIKVKEVQCNPGDRFLLCTDGVSRTLTHEKITAELTAAGNAEDGVRRLLRESLRAGACDNVTAAAAFF